MALDIWRPQGQILGIEREQYAGMVQTQEYLLEQLAELELALEDVGWQRLTGFGGAENEFSRDALNRIIYQARLNYIKNPLIKRSVLVQAHYVFAQGLTVKAVDKKVNDVVQATWDDPANKQELTTLPALVQQEIDLQCTGNKFFAFFRNDLTGRVIFRSIPTEQITDIIFNPDDRRDPWFYKREWVESELNFSGQPGPGTQRTVYYPALRYPGDIPTRIYGSPVETVPVYQVKVGGLGDMRFGIPEVYAALDWAKAYKDFLSDYATIVRAHARFAWNLVVKPGKNRIAGAKAKLNTAPTFPGSPVDKNAPPLTGSTWITDGANLTPIRTAGSTENAENGRPIKLQVAAAAGLPETFYGDADAGALATAKSLDRPTELKMRDRQNLWGEVIRTFLDFAVDSSIAAPQGALTGGIKRNILGVEELQLSRGRDRRVEVTFPDVLEHDVNDRVQAIVRAATLNAQGQLVGTLPKKLTSELFLKELGVPNVDEVLNQMETDGMFEEDEEIGAPPPAAGEAPSEGLPPPADTI